MPDKEGRAHFVLRTKLKTNNPWKTADKESRAHFVLRTQLKVLRMKLKTHNPYKTPDKEGRARADRLDNPPPPNHPRNIHNAMM